MQGEQLDLFAFHKKKHGGRMDPYTFEERKIIERLLKSGATGKHAAKKLGRSTNGINTEIRKNGGWKEYNAERAQKRAEEMRRDANKKISHALLGKSGPGVSKRIKNLEMQVEILFETIRELKGSHGKNK